MKKIIILATAMLLIIPASAERRTIKDRTENWLQRENVSEREEATNGDISRIGVAPEAPPVPIGEGLLALTVFAGVYAVSRKRKQIK
jgi:hypothetical protein